jgi:formylglycine-generating enzyme
MGSRAVIGRRSSATLPRIRVACFGSRPWPCGFEHCSVQAKANGLGPRRAPSFAPTQRARRHRRCSGFWSNERAIVVAMRVAAIAVGMGLLACEQEVYLDDHVCAGGEGPATVRIDGVCIDSTEVTNDDYQAFLSDEPSTTSQPEECAWNDSFVPAGWPPATGTSEYPVGSVDWCDARAYCSWADKRLCGRVGGGAVDWGARSDRHENEWYRACSGAAASRYPYGSDFDAARCVVSGDSSAPAGSKASCEGGYAGLFDLIGNVWEWTDSCVNSDPVGAEEFQCDRRGGAFTVQPTDADCTAGELLRRNLQQPDTGFRCCSD